MEVTAHLIILAYFFLLRIGEYTHSPNNKARKKRTIPLRREDVQLWTNGRILHHSAPLQTLLEADAVTICLENQKNGNKDATLHHTTSGDHILDPVNAAAHLVHAIATLPPNTPLGTFCTSTTKTQRIQPKEIREAIRMAAAKDNLAEAGYDMTRIGSHSLRSGGAMRLKLAGFDNDTIKKLGRWSSDTYLRYIQTQIGTLTAGIATMMAASLRFTCVAPKR